MSVWEGWVLEREADAFTAEVVEVLADRTGDRVVMKINLDVMSEQDRALCEPGAIFDMAVEDRCLSVAFRTDVWTAEEIEQIKARAHERWERMQQFID